MSTTWRGNQSCLLGPTVRLRTVGPSGLLRLEIPLSDPVVPLSETHVYVGSLRSAQVATSADRKQAVDLRRLALSYRPARDVGLLTLRKT
jgi:hypothetical protein